MGRAILARPILIAATFKVLRCRILKVAVSGRFPRIQFYYREVPS